METVEQIHVTQLALIDPLPIEWRPDERHLELARAGLANARRALRAAGYRRESEREPVLST